MAQAAGFGAVVLARDQPIPAALPIASPLPAHAMLLAAEPRKDEATFLATLPRLRSQAAFAAALGCTVAPLGLPPSSELPRTERASVLRKRLRICQEILDEFGIRLALEPVTPMHLRTQHPYAFIFRAPEMLDFALSVSPRCGLAIDSWHWHHGGADPRELEELPPGAVLDVHISDSPDLPPERIRDLERAAPGEGIIDFRTFFGALPYQGPLTLELFGTRLNGMDAEASVFEAARTARAMLTGL